mmetsp:Transcript_64240/g.162779  ORF Transcript_64240/g.162779 Transcript_64240/m.162779 type:complete len:226 (-) Transcript_64240:898-1575(-)
MAVESCNEVRAVPLQVSPTCLEPTDSHTKGGVVGDALCPPACATPPRTACASDCLVEGCRDGGRRAAVERRRPIQQGSDVSSGKADAHFHAPWATAQALDGLRDPGPVVAAQDGQVRITRVKAETQMFNRVCGHGLGRAERGIGGGRLATSGWCGWGRSAAGRGRLATPGEQTGGPKQGRLATPGWVGLVTLGRGLGEPGLFFAGVVLKSHRLIKGNGSSHGSGQ